MMHARSDLLHLYMRGSIDISESFYEVLYSQLSLDFFASRARWQFEIVSYPAPAVLSCLTANHDSSVKNIGE